MATVFWKTRFYYMTCVVIIFALSVWVIISPDWFRSLKRLLSVDTGAAYDIGFLVLFCGVVLLVSSGVISAVIARRMMKKTVALLNDQCDAQAFLYKWQKETTPLPFLNPMARFLGLSNLVVGYVNAGNPEMAIDVLKNKAAKLMPFCGAYYHVIYYNLLFESFLATGNVMMAESLLPYLYQYACSVHNKYKVNTFRCYELCVHQIAWRKENPEPHLEFFRQMQASSQCLCERVSLVYIIAEICAKMGDRQGYEQARDFVKQYGNTMDCAGNVEALWE